MLWRYSGSKKRLLKFLPTPPLGTSTIVEPFAGSAAYGLHYRPHRLVLAEANQDVRALWTWVTTAATVAQLDALEQAVPPHGTDIRTVGLDNPAETLMRLMISGAYVGQLSSYVSYSGQHSFDLTALKEALPYLRKSVQQPILSDYRQTLDLDLPATSMVLVDPPYWGTKANYIDKSAKPSKRDKTMSTTPQEVAAFVQQLLVPTLLTYGEGAADLFPQFDWKLATTRKVPVLRGGGTRDRREFYAIVNWR
jgi:site-specific DNA-adenine methylase